jgi:hypothetical protein
LERVYDLFEIRPDGSPIWKEKIEGHENAIHRLREVAAQTQSEVRLMHLPDQSVIAVLNARKT